MCVTGWIDLLYQPSSVLVVTMHAGMHADAIFLCTKGKLVAACDQLELTR